MEGFELFTDLDSFYSIDASELDDIIRYDMCDNCKIPMNVKSNNKYICPECHVIKENVDVSDMSTITSDSSYNTSNSINSQLRCTGSNSYKYQHLLRSSSEYSIIQDQNIKNILFECNYKSINKLNIPKDILLTVSEQYKQIRESKNIYRGTILRGILAAMTYYECLRRRLSHRPIEILEWFEINAVNYSKGDKIVRDLVDHGQLKINLNNIDINGNFIHSYSIRLGFEVEQINFLQELMDEVSKQKIINPNAKSSTKALSIIYVYIMAAKINITPDDLKEKFGASYGTIRSTSAELIKKIANVAHIFNKYNVPTKIVRTRKRRSKKESELVDDTSATSLIEKVEELEIKEKPKRGRKKLISKLDK